MYPAILLPPPGKCRGHWDWHLLQNPSGILNNSIALPIFLITAMKFVLRPSVMHLPAKDIFGKPSMQPASCRCHWLFLYGMMATVFLFRENFRPPKVLCPMR